MIKLKIPFNHKGQLFLEGTIVLLPFELEAKMVKAGSAEYVNPEEKQPAVTKPKKDGKNESQRSDSSRT